MRRCMSAVHRPPTSYFPEEELVAYASLKDDQKRQKPPWALGMGFSVSASSESTSNIRDRASALSISSSRMVRIWKSEAKKKRTIGPDGNVKTLSAAKAEDDALEEYIREALAQGYIRPSTSPAAAGFFFVKKKDGGYAFRVEERPPQFINDVLRDMLGSFVIAYIDDILIYSPDLPTHIQNVRRVLSRLLENQLYIKGEKCEFHQGSISFLGYIISPQGVVMDDRKVEAVTNWPIPRSVRELQRFLGFANFYRHFIRSFSSVAAPLTSLLKGNAKNLAWNPKAEAAFNELKERFTSAPILGHPDPSKPFVVEVDASNVGVGAVLSHRNGEPPKLRPVAFFSHKLSSAERNYGIGDKALLAMKLAFEEWRHWLEGARHPFLVLTDHKNLEYLRSAKRLNSRQARWSLFFSRSDFQITYHPGTRNTKADALSRMFEGDSDESETSKPILEPKVLLSPIRWEIDDEIRRSYETESVPETCPSDQMFVPASCRDRLIAWAHTSPTSGHPGETRTNQLLSGKYWWEGMDADIHRLISSCAVCSQCKTPRFSPDSNPSFSPIQHHQPSSHIWQPPVPLCCHSDCTI
ncbi:hypothetical protein NFI96_032636 [Prochilodus magdalenae]|nr:hypothetical protein NFI96_032636 [Prochilodus magdalenae]